MSANWLDLHRLPFDIIMTKIAHNDLTSLRSCMKVCPAWDDMIKKNPAVKDTVRDKMELAFGPEVSVDPESRKLPTSEDIINAKWFRQKELLEIEVIENFAARVREQIFREEGGGRFLLTACAASLAYHGLLGPAEETEYLELEDVDLTNIPSEHLAALASLVTSSCDVSIQNVIGIDMVSFLNSLQCQLLWIDCQSLGREETQALVQAMESRVEKVHLGSGFTFDVETLITYSGDGRCLYVWLFFSDDEGGEDPKRWNLKESLKNWAMRKNWAESTGSSFLELKRKRRKRKLDEERAKGEIRGTSAALEK